MVLSPERIEQTYFIVPCNNWHNSCRAVAKLLIECVNGPYTVNNTTLLKYLIYLEGNSTINCSACIDAIDWIPAVVAICKKIVPSLDNQIKMVKGGFSVIPIFEDLVNKGVKIDTSVLEAAVLCCSERAYDNRFKLIEFLVNHVVATTVCISMICRFRFGGYVASFADRQYNVVRAMLNQKIEATEDCLSYAIEVGNSLLVDLLIQYGCQVTENALIAACKIRNTESLIRILQCRIPPTKTAFRNLFTNMYSYSGSDTKKQVADMIDVLVANGYKVDYDDVLYALSKNCQINGLSRFNIKFDVRFVEECARQRFYPYADMNINIKPTVECLRIECARVDGLAQIKKIVSQGVRPNMDCLRVACDNRNNNTTTLKYLISEFKMKPDLKCLRLASRHISNPNLELLLDNTEDTVNKECIEQQQKIEDKLIKEQELIDLKTLQDMNDLEEKKLFDNLDDILEDKDKNKHKSDSKTESVDDKSDMQQLTDDLNLSEEFEDFDIDFDSTKRKKNKLKNVNLIVSADASKEIKLKERASPDNKRLKTSAKPDVLKLFGVRGATNAKVSYFDIRKLLLTYITDNSLYDKNNQTLIRPNKDLCKVLKLGTYKGKYIPFTNFDKLVNLCYLT